MKYLLFLFAIAVISGCASYKKVKVPLTSENFRDYVKFSINSGYYNSIYTGPHKGCFPSDVTNTCFNYSKNSYELKLDRKLNLKTLEVEINNNDITSIGGSRDYLFLVAGEITLQLGFKYLMHYEEQAYEGCSGSSAALTNFQKLGNSVTATTHIKNNTSCLSSRRYYFVMFNDYKDITDGIVSVKYNMVSPFVQLYGEGNNLLKHKNVFTVTNEASNESVFFSNTKIAAWKKYMDADTLAKGLREKLSIINNEYTYDVKSYESQEETIKVNPIDNASISVE